MKTLRVVFFIGSLVMSTQAPPPPDISSQASSEQEYTLPPAH